MTIQKGRPWGETCTVPERITTVDCDADLARADPAVPVVLTGGDLFIATGSPEPASPGQTRTMVRIDALSCLIETGGRHEQRLAASRIEIGRWIRLWPPSPRYVCVTNPGLVKGANVAPRAHPNDGRLDVLTIAGSMTLGQRIIARRRAAFGDHLGHPDITVTSSTHTFFERVPGDGSLRIDGERITRWDRITIEVVPDYWRVIL